MSLRIIPRVYKYARRTLRKLDRVCAKAIGNVRLAQAQTPEGPTLGSNLVLMSNDNGDDSTTKRRTFSADVLLKATQPGATKKSDKSDADQEITTTFIKEGESAVGLKAKYLVLDPLEEQGGMSLTWKARREKDGKVFVLKKRPAYSDCSPADRQKLAARFIDEYRIMAKMDTTEVDIGIGNNPDYFLMEFIHGTDAQKWFDKVRKREPLKVKTACQIMIKVLDHLTRYKKAVVRVDHEYTGTFLAVGHRDIKPGNIMLKEDEHGRILDEEGNLAADVELIDYGIAKMPDSERTRTLEVLVTPGYGAPETLLKFDPTEEGGGKFAGQHSDIYSLGIILYEFLTGKDVFENYKQYIFLSASTKGTLTGHLTDLYFKMCPENLYADYPHGSKPTQDLRQIDIWEVIFGAALVEDPAQRYQSYEQFQWMLQYIVDYIR